MLEHDVQRCCLDYLDANRIMYLRLNSGDVFRPGGNKMYRVKGCPKGTADLLVLACDKATKKARPIFCEFKSSKGKQTVEQATFEYDVASLGYEYYLIRDLDELIEVLK